jgi:signal transduction histidine kinase
MSPDPASRQPVTSRDGHLSPGFSLAAVLRQLPTGVVVAELPSGRVVQGSDRLAEIWRRPLGSTVEADDYTTWEGLHPDGRPYLPEEWPLTRSLHAGEVVEQEEIEIVRGDGSRGVVLVSSAPIDDDVGQRIGAATTLTDVTEERRLAWERRFLNRASAHLSTSLDLGTTLRNVARLALPALADWCAVDLLDDSGHIKRLVVEHRDPEKSRLAEELERRYPPLLTNRLGVGNVLRTGMAEVYREVSDSAAGEVAQDDRHLQLMREMGIASVMVVPLRARDRTLGALVFAVGDPERAYGDRQLALAEELAVAAAMAIDNARLYQESQAANRAKADFLAIISHELRTPLTAIIGYSELMGLGVPEPISDRQREQVERIELSARHLLQLIEEILTMANLETGQTHVRSAAVDVGDLLRRAEAIARPLAEAKALTLEVEPVPGPLEVRSDGEKLLQVLLNLLSNAVKFTEAGGVRIRARSDGEHLAIEISDTGVGLEKEHWEKVFQPFWQVEHPVTRRAGGTGLGLAISQRLITLLGGSIDVESEAGRGSTFTVRVPIEP